MRAGTDGFTTSSPSLALKLTSEPAPRPISSARPRGIRTPRLFPHFWTRVCTATQRLYSEYTSYGLQTLRPISLTLPLSGRQGAWGGVAECQWWPVHSRGLFGIQRLHGNGRNVTFMPWRSIYNLTEITQIRPPTAAKGIIKNRATTAAQPSLASCACLLLADFTGCF